MARSTFHRLQRRHADLWNEVSTGAALFPCCMSDTSTEADKLQNMKEIADANPAAFNPHPFAILGVFIPEVRLDAA